jgi:hypothetical protein
MLLFNSWSIVPKVYAACDPGKDGLKLTDCFYLNPTSKTTVGAVYNTPTVLINLIVRNLFVVAGIILFFLIIYSGYQFISGGVKGQEQAKTTMTTAIGGFIVMFAAYWILQIIKVVTGADILF